MAANLIPCASNFCFVFCSCTSCALQNGHQSAERKNKSTVPFVPFSVSLDTSSPNWSRAVKGGIFWPTFGPVNRAGRGEEDLSDPQPSANRHRENMRTSIDLVFNAWFPGPSDLRSEVS